MTAINLPGQLEVPLIVDHKPMKRLQDALKESSAREQERNEPRDVKIAKLLRSYEERPTSETWSRIQALAAEILK